MKWPTSHLEKSYGKKLAMLMHSLYQWLVHLLKYKFIFKTNKTIRVNFISSFYSFQMVKNIILLWELWTSTIELDLLAPHKVCIWFLNNITELHLELMKSSVIIQWKIKSLYLVVIDSILLILWSINNVFIIFVLILNSFMPCNIRYINNYKFKNFVVFKLVK